MTIVISSILIVVLTVALIFGIIFSAGDNLWNIGFGGNIGGIFFGSTGIAGGADYSTDPISVEGVDLRELDIGWAAGSVTVRIDESVDRPVFEEDAGENDTDKLCWKLSESGKLQIRFAHHSSIFILKTFAKKNLVVRLPASLELSTLRINTLAASGEVSGLTVGTLKIDSASGATTVTDCRITADCSVDQASGKTNLSSLEIGGALKIDSASGSIDADGIRAHRIKVGVASGSIAFANSECVDLDTDSASGSLLYCGSFETANCDSASGRKEFRLTNVPSSIEIDTASGTTTIYLPADAGFTVDMDAASGTVHSGFSDAIVKKHSAIRQGTAGLCDIEVDAASGDVYINPLEG